jgi:hypothetical protein
MAPADENGVSFWVPGFFGSLAATPQQPGWSLASIYYHTDVSGSGNIAVSREITIGQFNPKLDASVNANVHGIADVGFVIPSYVFATPLFGGQVSAGLLMAYGNNDASLNATATGTLGPIPFTKSISLQQDTMGFGDLLPMFAERWNAGINNYMAYLTGDIPVGRYSSSNLANIGIGHGALDGGLGYTYFDPKAGHEFSAVAGLTGSFRESIDELYQRHGFPPRLGRIAVFDQAIASGCRRVRLRSAQPRQGLRPAIVPVRIPRHRYRSSDRGYISCRGHAGLLEPEGLQRIRQCQQTRRLERVGHAGAIAGACRRVFTAADPDQIFAA